MSPAVETLDLTKTFVKKTLKGSIFKRMIRRVTTKPEHVTAVDHVNLQIGEGELFGLLGPNGAGKTSTIKLLCTLLVPDQGTAKVNGYDIVKEPNKVRESVGVVTGGERGLYWRLTAHYMDEADQLCDRIAIIDNGKVIGLGTPAELKKSLSQADIIQINASNVPEAAESLLKNIEGISEVALSFDDSDAGHAQLRIHTMDAEGVLPEITQTLVSKGVKIHALQEIEPTLEDVFIGLTGRKLRD